MRLVTIIALFLSAFLFSHPLKATTKKVFTEQGYPYDLLIKRTNEVKIIYSENQGMINCRVQLSWQEQEVTTQTIKVKQIKFNEKPLSTCLLREQAKTILAQTFN